jgi:hypothetical protein
MDLQQFADARVPERVSPDAGRNAILAAGFLVDFL